ncbi:DUF4397 domain-containing protein [Hungatella hathewayi]|uniref:DUF4397 domain-containing protein n=1 Tax=Hungatella hathewayi TaxID=154046 RepID=UPI00356B1A24
MDTLSYMQNDADTPVVPLPNPGEGGPVPDGEAEGNFPVVPLPNPGEGGPIPDFDNGQTPVIPLPNPGEGGPLPTFPNRPNNGIWGSIITVFPRPIIPCYFCSTTQYGVVRFLNAAAGYNPFIIYINNQMVVNGLDNAEVSQYGRVSSGMQTVTVSGQNGYVYIQKQINVPLNGAVTVAIINTNSGLDLMEITDSNCNGGLNTGCFRVCNLSNTNRSVNVTLNGGAVIFQNVNYREVTSFRYLPAGYYTVSVSNSTSFSGSPLLTSNIYIRGNVSYTLYVFNWNNSQDAIRILIVEDRRN